MKNTGNLKESIDKINLEELIATFRDVDPNAFSLYVKSVWKDLVQRSDKIEKGVNKLTFIQYYHLPGIISERVFSVFDADCDGYLSNTDFYNGMTTLFSKPFEDLLFFIFNIFDTDFDGKISKEDIKIIIQYIPLNSKESISHPINIE
jgi:Ca2+-binding EF-hand superfamily protein